MIHPIPPGTRDVLPDEMRELRAITERCTATFERAGYGEVWTPALEYEEVLRAGDAGAAGAGYRLFDDQGHVLALRSDMTIPIARLVATRFPDWPSRCACATSRTPTASVGRGSGQQREFLQAGIELIGVAGAEGEAEVIALLLPALDAAGLARHRIGPGRRRALPRPAGDSLEVPEERRDELLGRLSRARPGRPRAARGPARACPSRRAGCWSRLPELRGGPEVLERAHGRGRRTARRRPARAVRRARGARAWPTG